ncbi:MAG TPA: hypothetical protein VD761_07705 [Solirubrobacterales bacterium]|nr:hypothetical protein [Solirubrobacterales bacterium]
MEEPRDDMPVDRALATIWSIFDAYQGGSERSCAIVRGSYIKARSPGGLHRQAGPLPLFFRSFAGLGVHVFAAERARISLNVEGGHVNRPASADELRAHALSLLAAALVLEAAEEEVEARP